MNSINNFINKKLTQVARWILFIPVSFIVYWSSTFIVYIGITFLYYFLSQLKWYFLIPAIFPAFFILSIIAGGLWSCFYIGLFLSPNRLLCWLLAGWFIFSALSGISGYCTPIPVSEDKVIIQLPCWAYIILQLYIVICLVISAIIASVNIGERNKVKNI
ncbi:MAG: hypothetical protein A2312_00365 [Candidatus Staskawiczbacteria bacterium RIFOXYB2_FULL_32_9]|uniref:Uncharacterized protein n=1 Tax=Candidatus Staskawiczbacteria bacterium RIFOXYD1_FULL_32_13 TaxID=1802234 RepID=A0A1G2JL61_9BACT|nr:MAG: hypothetical protein UR22_C0001G0058 [Parcubacteria group bacterium GW2011_GWC2_32_10]OGZ77560.1 MAG: hypothetical protein A2256_02255 [Candidatus Staskawiczbacteria bacterium RIFOXYA2_FULL_32_7]OGZ78262.1 MAG: hypothetical protein A2360_03785 [Candidatus Staskawiczbacteria bacterium RIFOXYB1_FULL_32_11]OGZ84547.1 MAG: hypothetical protein A2312_00365 [Candidatus Staskawiczbacteria bacterium RIFOXYB2_FULL_32_9]OGZ85155.1 MAG: hypothetical protein A2463_00095 [Candidatus Staskawiczbacter